MDLLAGGLGYLLDPAHWQGRDAIQVRLVEHIVLCGAAVLTALIVALPVGAAIGHSGRFAFLAVNLANLGRAIPSYAVMGLIVPVSLAISPRFGLALIPTFLAMTLLAIPPILVNAYTGIREVDRDVVEAGRGMGMREREILRRIELPVAIPVILGGLRTAAVQVVATATLGAWFGLGGLGRFLADGIARRDFDMLWAGVILVAGLALLTELVLALLQRSLTSPGLRRAPTRTMRQATEIGSPGW